MPNSRKLNDELRYKILHAIADGNDRNDIYQRVKAKISKPTLGRILKQLEHQEGLIIKMSNTRPHLFKLSQKGRQNYRNIRNNIIFRTPEDLTQFTIFLQRYKIRYPIREKGELWCPTIVQLNNCLKSIAYFKNATIEVYNDSYVIILVKQLEGKDPYRLLLEAHCIADGIVDFLTERAGFVFGLPERCEEFEMEYSNKATQEICKKFRYLPGVIDHSQTDGELVFNNPEDVVLFRDMPRTLEKIWEEGRALHYKIDILSASFQKLMGMMLSFYSSNQSEDTDGEDYNYA